MFELKPSLLKPDLKTFLVRFDVKLTILVVSEEVAPQKPGSDCVDKSYPSSKMLCE